MDGETMGQRIYRVRADLGPDYRTEMSLGDFAAGIARRTKTKPRSDSTIMRWEKGEGKPSPAEALAIAEMGEVRIEWLVRGEEPMLRPAPRTSSSRARSLRPWEANAREEQTND